MRKKSHISLAKFLLHNSKEHQLYEHKKSFYFGSILPDIKPSFLTKRHTFEDTFDILINEIKRITLDYDFNKGINKYYARRLGIITHYLADYCTFPHNSCYTGSMADHVYYEKELKYQLLEYIELEDIHQKSVKGQMLESFDEIIEFIRSKHKEYLSTLKAVKHDIRYIIELCSKVVEAILAFFNMAFEALNSDAEPALQFS
ncbi:MAG: zinc dependent phospholipase C family protein [Clostridiales bacterium]|nr:zinc dependent phospholipase C family protein [Clostridiales bacterium]